jgi:hypothetical protein
MARDRSSRRSTLNVAHAYTPGLCVTAGASVSRVRRLPLRGDVIVARGRNLRAEDVVARTALPGNVHTVKVASILGIPPDDIREQMLKKEGERVTKDEIIASSKSFFGVFTSKCATPVSGTIEAISNVTGQVAIREAPLPVEVAAYIDGEVVEVLPGEGVVMRATGAFVQGIFGIGGETCGTIRVVCESPRDPLDETAVSRASSDGAAGASAAASGGAANGAAGAILVGGALVTLAALRAAVAAGARAVIAGGISASDLESFLGYDLGVAITGQEEKGITLLVTEGFGDLAMADRTFELLRDCAGMRASVNGATQIRAGVLRPEIIVPRPDAPVHDAAAAGGGLRVGSRVRTIREPWFGRRGVVTGLPQELREIETGARVRVLTLRMDDGAEITLPRANVEMMEA